VAALAVFVFKSLLLATLVAVAVTSRFLALGFAPGGAAVILADFAPVLAVLANVVSAVALSHEECTIHEIRRGLNRDG
jgi:hypothetical protein